jgi:hypothetical protein
MYEQLLAAVDAIGRRVGRLLLPHSSYSIKPLARQTLAEGRGSAPYFSLVTDCIAAVA